MQPANGDLHKYSVQDTVPLAQGGYGGMLPIIFQMATAADTITPWGASPPSRDRELRRFWRSEPWLASSIGVFVNRNASYGWKLTGPPLTVRRCTDILQNATFGSGFHGFLKRFSLDRATQDNGAYIEVMRTGPQMTHPVVGIANLDPARCVPTMDPDYPVIYTDRKGVMHNLRPWQVIRSQEMPSTEENLNGLGTCAVSRVLRAAQMIRDFEIYKSERAAGRDPGAIHFVSGFNQSMMDDAIKLHAERGDNAGLIRYIAPLILASINPEQAVSTATILLKSLPEGYNEEISNKWYAIILALALGTDPQDIAPLSGASLGTGAQSQVLAQKSQGKGAAEFQQEVSHILNWCGILPRNVEFVWDEDDAEGDKIAAENAKLRAEGRKLRLDSGEITVEVAQQLALEAGDLSQEQYDLLRAEAEAGQESGPDLTLPTDQNATTDGQSPISPDDSAGIDGAAVVTDTTKAITPVVTKADQKRANAYFDRLMPEYAGILDAEPV